MTFEPLPDFTFLPRKFGLKGGKIFMFGAPKCGKTLIALNFAKSFKKSAYVDLNDLRINFDDLNSALLKMYLEKNIELLIVDNFCAPNHLKISLPRIANIVLIGDSRLCPNDFEKKQILSLCFEEFVAFDSKNQSMKNLFSQFLKFGNSPEMPFEPSFKRANRMSEILKLSLQNDFEIFSKMLRFQSQFASTYRIYNALKKSIKISKDRIYALLQKWEENALIFWVRQKDFSEFKDFSESKRVSESKNTPHSENPAKKLYFADFALSNLISFEKNISAQAENMLFLELIKLSENGTNGEIFCGKNGELILGKTAYLSIPFATQELINTRLKKLAKMYENIIFVTLSFEAQGSSDNANWKALDFINFALDC